ncbi:MAG TPA: right-handed parallel beta-helix repeat-containing protein [Candidatus Thermoplasmatota archaeon]|nr:right-handed parallel beta-helix repeat-containing protein [Candidatus Thermoplasmatota archaeon]
MVRYRTVRWTKKLKKITASFLIFILLSLLLPLVNPGETTSPSTWYISPTGNDRNPGDITNPFKTLQKAINASSNGDTIYLRAGHYNTIFSTTKGILIDRSGTPDSWFTISGYPGERAVINGRGYTLAPNSALLRIGTAAKGQSYVRITNIIIENSSRDGIRVAQQGIQTSHHIRVDNVTINNCAYRGLMFWSTNPNKAWCHNLTVENCTINNTQSSRSMGEGITFSGCKDITFHHNTVTHCPKIMLDLANNTKNCNIYKNTIVTTQGSGIKLDGSQSNKVNAWDENISIYNNHFSGSYTAIKIGVEKKGGCKNISFYNNIINTVSSYPGVKLEGATGYSQLLDNIVIKHNTIQVSGTGSPLQVEQPPAKLRNIYVANNIFQGDGSASWQVRSSVSNFTDSCFHFYNNIYNHTTKPANTAWVDGRHKFETTAILSSPQFVNRKTGDFHLNSTSPAIDAADSTYTVPFDYDGRTRPQNTIPDIGAYEFSAMNPPINPPTITNVQTTPEQQQIGGYINISCEITENDAPVDNVWVNITYPDATTHNYSMNKGFYLNQTYDQIGDYQFLIWVHDTNDNTNISTGYVFHIMPVLHSTFIVGLISTNQYAGGPTLYLNAKLLLYIEINPLTVTLLSSNEKILISKEYIGYVGPKFIIGVFNGVVLSE